MLVGDILLSAREAVPDLPGVLPAPGSEITFAAQGGSGNPFNAGTYFLVATYTNLWGETSVGPETSLALDGASSITVTVTASPFISFIVSLNVYLGYSAGGEIMLYNFAAPLTDPTYTIDTTTAVVVGTPPEGNCAFLPDTGGPVAGAGQIFRWLTDALNRLSSLNGGIPDQSGFSTQTGKANYQIPGDWQSLGNAWYDGYPLMMGSSSLVFRHNTITALSGMMSFTQVTDRLIVELFAQADRTAGVGSLSVNMTALDVVAQTAALDGWVLPFGLAQIGVPPTYEVVSYTMEGDNLVSLVRGLGGTNPRAWLVGTPVLELNVQITGMRAPQLYAPGTANNSLTIPSSWVPLMHLYLLARYRRIEQQEDEASKLMKQFEDGAKEATKRKPVLGDRQINPQDSVAVDVYPLLSKEFGGGIIP